VVVAASDETSDYVWLGQNETADRNLIGGKAHSINTMVALGLPVPPAFALTTNVCRRLSAAGGDIDDQCVVALRDGMFRLECATGRRLGDPRHPLLVSVRSGAAVSMPGMMDTVLNLGINDEARIALSKETGDEAYAADTQRRFEEQFARVVGHTAPNDPWEQLLDAVSAVFKSWMSPRAVAYRQHHGLGDSGGTAVAIQAMVFGNLDDTSGTGVLFTRNPLTGDSAPFGEWLQRGQGEDVVSGRFDANPLSALEELLPDIHEQLMNAGRRLEAMHGDVLDIEFTVESGRLWLLQSRAAKRSPDAAVRLAVAMESEGVITRDEALLRVLPEQIAALLRPRVSPEERAKATILVRGEPACPGVGSGVVGLTCEDVEAMSDQGTDAVLARPTTDPDDVHGMILSNAILTETGGATCHAAVVSRELGTPCVVGCGVGSLSGLAGLLVTVDGSSGEVYEGVLTQAPCSEADLPDVALLAEWARAAVPESSGSLPELFSRVHAALVGCP
jgi:pyruvate, orthophosphate dikinase